MTSRRRVLAFAAASPLLLRTGPARATPDETQAAVERFTGGAPVEEGGLTLKVPLLVENGNAVPLTVSVESPMTEDDHVTEIAVFNERNPLPDVVTFHFTPFSGRAEAQTRMRLNGSQNVHAVARMSDGSFRHAVTDVIVTAPACAEG